MRNGRVDAVRVGLVAVCIAGLLQMSVLDAFAASNQVRLKESPLAPRSPAASVTIRGAGSWSATQHAYPESLGGGGQCLPGTLSKTPASIPSSSPASLVAAIARKSVKVVPGTLPDGSFQEDRFVAPRAGFGFLGTSKPPARLNQLGRQRHAFIENKGQVDERVEFYLKNGSQTVWYTPERIVFDLFRSKANDSQRSTANGSRKPPKLLSEREKVERERLVFSQNLVGFSDEVTIEGIKLQPGVYNYLLGDDPTKWITGIRGYAELIYSEIYEDIDLRIYGKGRDLEQEFIVKPGGNLSQIQVTYRGIEELQVTGDGSLVILTAFGALKESAPRVYQQIDGRPVAVDGRFKLLSENTYTFEVGPHDLQYALVIDPTLIFSTYLGGSGSDAGNGIAVDVSGSAYVTGYTDLNDFPIENAFQPFFAEGGRDAFITKLNPNGSELVYSTFLGGSGLDEANGIAVDDSGQPHVTGLTNSMDFPTENPVQGAVCCDRGVFVAKLNSTGSALVYSTYLASTGMDEGRAVAVDSEGNAYVTGVSIGNNFPTTPGAFQNTFGGGSGFFGGDAFVTKLSATGSLVYSTYLGSGSDDIGNGIAIDAAGNAFVTGQTFGGFPVENAFQPDLNGGFADAFVTKVNPDGSSLDYSTFLGGNGFDIGQGIAVDAGGSAYVTGVTTSTNFPTANALQPVSGGSEDAFVTKFSPSGSALVYSTYLGGDFLDNGVDIALEVTPMSPVTPFRLTSRR